MTKSEELVKNNHTIYSGVTNNKTQYKQILTIFKTLLPNRSQFLGAIYIIYNMLHKLFLNSGAFFHSSKLFSSSRKLIRPIVTMPFSSICGRIFSFTTTIFLKESLTLISERFSWCSFSSVGIS